MPSKRKSAAVAVGLVLLCQAAGVAGALVTDPGQGSWYAGLVKPPFNPPSWVFAPVWTTLYTLMGLAAWRVWRVGARDGAQAPAARGALTWFGVQLALNAVWTPVFFGAEQLAAALGIIVVMAAAIAWTLRRFWPLDRPAAWMLAPYLAWVSFATVLNGSLLALNP